MPFLISFILPIPRILTLEVYRASAFNYKTFSLNWSVECWGCNVSLSHPGDKNLLNRVERPCHPLIVWTCYIWLWLNSFEYWPSPCVQFGVCDKLLKDFFSSFSIYLFFAFKKLFFMFTMFYFYNKYMYNTNWNNRCLTNYGSYNTNIIKCCPD